MKKFIPAVLLFIPALAAAQLELAGVSWQIASGAKRARFENAEKIPLRKQAVKTRISVSLANKGKAAVEGAVLRCAFSMRLAGQWTVPFWLEERRVAKVKPFATAKASIPHLELQNYLKRLAGTGFWPDALRVQVMLEPRAGDDISKNLAESIISVE